MLWDDWISTRSQLKLEFGQNLRELVIVGGEASEAGASEPPLPLSRTQPLPPPPLNRLPAQDNSYCIFH